MLKTVKNQAKNNFKRRLSNSFGSLGYFFAFFQWLWAVLLYFSVLKATISLVSPTSTTPVIPSPRIDFILPGWVEITIVIVVTTIMLAVSAYALINLPSKIVKTSRAAVRKTSGVAAPLIIKAQHRHDTKTSRMRITPAIIFGVKILLVAIPLVACLASELLDKQSIDYTIAIIIGYGLAGLSVIFFALQYGISKILGVKSADLY